MSKQDGYSPRTAVDLERRYNFGQTFADVYGLVADARKIAEEAANAYEELNQEQVFNLLTNYGESQGIYRGDDGNVYVNASYIKSGKLSGANLEVDAATIKGELSADIIKGGTLDCSEITVQNLTIGAADIKTALEASDISADRIKGGILDFSYVAATNLVVDHLYSHSEGSNQYVSIGDGVLTFRGGSISDNVDILNTKSLDIRSEMLKLHSDVYFHFYFSDGSYCNLSTIGLTCYNPDGSKKGEIRFQ